ncbi:MAG: PEGA domain-containing protein [Methanomicrobiales archaeon]|nr:PEGA domain-containing protein [Methanomicrobiales archaeon]
MILDGSYKGTANMTIPDVGAGVHTLRLEKAGYYPYQDSIIVNAGLTTNVTWILTEIPPPVVNGSISVQSTPTGAAVILDGEGKGTTNTAIPDVSAGVHTLRLEKTGYYPWENPVIVVAGETANVAAVLSMVPPATGSIAVETDPAEANVYLDTEFIGLSPVSVGNVTPGSHSVQIEKDGYEPREVNTTVSAGATTIVSVALTALPPPTTGSLDVFSEPTGANVYVDTDFKGITNLSVPDLYPGLHTVRVEKDGYIPYENASVPISAGAVTQVYAILDPVPVPETGEIDISSNPSGAAAYLDGVLKGTTPLTIVNLDPQLYTIRIEKSGYLTWEENVTVVAGEAALVVADLIPIPTPTPTQTPTPIPTTTLQGTGGLLVVSEPTATVFVDGVERGKSNEVIGNVIGGTRNVTLVKAGYKTTSFPVTIPVTRVAITPKIFLEPAGVPTTVPTTAPTTLPTTSPTVTLTTAPTTIPTTSGPFPPAPSTGSIFVYSVPFGCSVYVDEIFKGTSPGFFGLIEPGTHELKLVRTGYLDDVRSITVHAGDISTVLVMMVPDVGSIISAFL